MKIHELKIEGFKSIGSITLTEPNPFSVFVGPNASGKSNIFEALEFMQLCNTMSGFEAAKLLGNPEDILNQLSSRFHSQTIEINADLGVVKPWLIFNSKYDTNAKQIEFSTIESKNWGLPLSEPANLEKSHYYFIKDKNYIEFSNFTRLFAGKPSLVKKNILDDSKISIDASNLEKVLKRILNNPYKRNEIIEILQLLIPGFSKVEIRTEELSGSDNLLIYESALEKPLTKRLISDGTFNILAILAAIYQSDKPQFLCIEEPENGLNPKVIRLLVDLFRDKCKEKGHYIWLNTHSQTLVAELTPEEIILVDKVNGQTQTKQIKGKDLHGLKMDEALFTNVLGGGIPW